MAEKKIAVQANEAVMTPLLVRLPVIAFLTSLSPRTIASMKAAGQLPFVKIGTKAIRFDPVEVIAHLNRLGRVSATGERRAGKQHMGQISPATEAR